MTDKIKKEEKKQIGVLGGGSWGTAIMKILTDNLSENEHVNWYIRNKEDVEYIKKSNRNRKYLQTVVFDPKKIFVSDNVKEIIDRSEMIIIAIPSAFIKDTLENCNANFEFKTVVSTVKGLIPDENLILAEYFNRRFGVDSNNFGLITGPCHAEEVALERLSYLTVASENLFLAGRIAGCIDSHYVKTEISDDIYGTEYSAVLKNVFALAAGICYGLGYGDNFLSVLISNGIREIKRFVDVVHPIKRDIKSSAYLGDLLVTAYSKFSRNRIFGTMIGKGYSVNAIKVEMDMIAEGYYGVKSIYRINRKYNISMPITDAVYNILYENKPPAFEIKLLTDKIR